MRTKFDSLSEGKEPNLIVGDDLADEQERVRFIPYRVYSTAGFVLINDHLRRSEDSKALWLR